MLALALGFTALVLLGLYGLIVLNHHKNELCRLVDEGCNRMGDDIEADLAPLKLLGLID